MIAVILSFIEGHFNSMIGCITIIPSQLGYSLLWYIAWLLLPKEVRLFLRTFFIKLLARIAMVSYKVFKLPITKAQKEIENTFGAHAVELIQNLITSYGGYSSMEDMINSKAYRYIHLGDNLERLGKYTLVNINGLSEFVETSSVPTNSRYKGHFIIYTDKKGQRYDITPRGKFPDDLPNGEYELLAKVGSTFELVDYYNNPSEISIKRREF